MWRSVPYNSVTQSLFYISWICLLIDFVSPPTFFAPCDIYQYTGEKALREINEAYDRKQKLQVKDAQTISRYTI